MTQITSAAMTADTHDALRTLLLRSDGQEDLCLALYRPSTGQTRTSALVYQPIPPEPGDRRVHGNVTITADYIMRGINRARDHNCGLVLLHSHPAGRRWQHMSGSDRDTEASYANLVREVTGLPLVGMTLAGGDTSWSARHWDRGVGASVAPSESQNVRVIADRLVVSWNDTVETPPARNPGLIRTIDAWGPKVQADLARRRVLIVGAGSVGLDVAVHLAASGLQHMTIMDFDIVEVHNLDRLIGATSRDVALRRTKTHVARRETLRNATAVNLDIRLSDRSICETEGLREALDHDLIFCCVDRPWPRAVLNALAYTDLIPVIDGGIAIDTLPDSTMRNATWRSHVIRPGRPCMSCNRQLSMGLVTPDIQGLLDDPIYIEATATSTRSRFPAGHNVAPLSINVAAALLAQYVSFSVAPGGFGDPGPLQYLLSTHHLEHLGAASSPDCLYEPDEPLGDRRDTLTGAHIAAEDARSFQATVPSRIKLLRTVDDGLTAIAGRLDRLR